MVLILWNEMYSQPLRKEDSYCFKIAKLVLDICEVHLKKKGLTKVLMLMTTQVVLAIVVINADEP